jgi:hypothetical protein
MVAFKPGPIQQPIGETPPKRKVGRPPGVQSRTVSLKPQIAGMLMTMNLALYVIPPLRVDVLDDVEIEALARALDEQAKRSIRFRKALEMALTAGSGGTLFGVMAIIGARRASRHGMAPPEVDQMLGNLLAMSVSGSAKAATDAGGN